ncbi:hypothetical protein [Crocinitomix catalasitica]|uniref:hypothetical protein n=1 Tax=Crocinitomix catalasitica TaxID=184607 RepID=UPI0004835B39|nr:hypothetical protein [Crocinitomix catalasitica]
MKPIKRILTLLSFCLFIQNSHAQANKSIEQGDLLIAPSISLFTNTNYIVGGLNGTNLIPAVSLNFEYAFHDYVSAGLEFGYSFRTYQSNFIFFIDPTRYNYSTKVFSLRASFHYLELIKNLVGEHIGGLNSEKLDFYVTLLPGFIVTDETQKWTTAAGDHKRKERTTGPSFGSYAGFRYYFSNAVAVHVEGGYGNFSRAKIGLTFKL